MGRSSKPDTELKSVSSKFKHVEQLLGGCAREVYCGAKLYFVNEETLQAFLLMRQKAEQEIEDVNKRRFALYPYVNILNDLPIAKHTLTQKRPYSLLVDPVKVYGKLEGKFTVWCNTLRKAARDEIDNTEGISEKEAASIKQGAEKEIKRGQKVYDMLCSRYDSEKEEFTGLDVRASNFLYSTVKGYINMTDIENRASQGYLRTEVPNIVCELDEEILLHRKNYVIQAFHDEASYAFSNVYLIHKDESKDES